MPRTSLKEVRSEQILAAYSTCITRHGLEGATQERIAEQAGVKRSILRHYLGNREEMIDALIDHVGKDWKTQTEELVNALPHSRRVSVLLEILFDKNCTADKNSILIFHALITAVEQHPDINSMLIDWTSQFVQMIETELRLEYPDVADDLIFSVAFGVVGIYFNIDSFAFHGSPDEWWTASKKAAQLLVNSLGDVKQWTY